MIGTQPTHLKLADPASLVWASQFEEIIDTILQNTYRIFDDDR